LDPIIAWGTANGDHIITILSSGFVLAVLGIVARLVRRGWQEVHGRGRVIHIRSSHSPSVQWIEDIQERVFPPDECDPRGLLGSRIRQSRFDLFGHPHSNEAMIAIAYVKGRQPVAYLSAEYFADLGAVFFWYIVSLEDQTLRTQLVDLNVDWQQVASVKDGIPSRLIEKLLDVCSGGEGWKYVVAEVDVAEIPRARKKVGAFQRYAHEILVRVLRSPIKRLRLRGRKLDPDAPRVFKVDMDFMMPLHDADQLHEAHQHESPGWLVFAPRIPERYRRNGRYEIASAEVKNELLNALLIRGYRSAENEDYNTYIRSFYEDMVRDLPPIIAHTANRNLMS